MQGISRVNRPFFGKKQQILQITPAKRPKNSPFWRVSPARPNVFAPPPDSVFSPISSHENGDFSARARTAHPIAAARVVPYRNSNRMASADRSAAVPGPFFLALRPIGVLRTCNNTVALSFLGHNFQRVISLGGRSSEAAEQHSRKSKATVDLKCITMKEVGGSSLPGLPQEPEPPKSFNL